MTNEPLVVFGGDSSGLDVGLPLCFSRASVVRYYPSVPETFLVGPYPDSPEKYWWGIIKAKVDIGIQLEQDFGEDYHAQPGRPDVRMMEQTSMAAGVTRRLYLVGDEPRRFIHYSVKCPDFGVPDIDVFTLMLRAYQRDVDSLCRDSTRVLTHVHCWAGMGRSGTFVLARVLSMMEDGEGGSNEDVLAVLRQQRPGMVETPRQKAFAETFRGKARRFDSAKTGKELGLNLG